VPSSQPDESKSEVTKRIWFHGTSAENAAEILKVGFLPDSYFARDLADALEFGGMHIFHVLLDVDSTNWQILLADAVPPDRIARYVEYEVVKGVDYSQRREAFFGESYMGGIAEPKEYPSCPYCGGNLQQPVRSS
jgi:hypothetical protein